MPPDVATEDRAPTDDGDPAEFDVIVVGAGFGGIYALYHLRELGFSVHVFEMGDGVGGTWYWNRYPGARCDVPSLEYSYGFSKELQQEWEWTEIMPAREEIEQYLNHVVDRFDLRRDIQLGTRVTAATFDDATARGGWSRPTTGERFSAQFCVMATGCLSAPTLPEVAGRDSFAGRVLQTSLWPHEGVDFTGLRVGLIGTGSSGVQATPEIAREAEHLYVFQRTATYSFPAVPRHDRPGAAGGVQGQSRRFPASPARDLRRGRRLRRRVGPRAAPGAEDPRHALGGTARGARRTGILGRARVGRRPGRPRGERGGRRAVPRDDPAHGSTTRRWPRSCRPAAIRSDASGWCSVSTTTRRSTATTSRSSTCETVGSRRSRRPASAPSRVTSSST